MYLIADMVATSQDKFCTDLRNHRAVHLSNRNGLLTLYFM